MGRSHLHKQHLTCPRRSDLFEFVARHRPRPLCSRQASFVPGYVSNSRRVALENLIPFQTRDDPFVIFHSQHNNGVLSQAVLLTNTVYTGYDHVVYMKVSISGNLCSTLSPLQQLLRFRRPPVLMTPWVPSCSYLFLPLRCAFACYCIPASLVFDE
ncbi:hypothetical protein AcW1_002533 [Taiwanofungus camphoratus]|nr:hypothetical protein AcW1_002533 [Antrodia cinnamomea]